MLESNLPKHVAFIMDGNGRWATTQGLARLEGHRQGVKTVEALVSAAPNLGVETLTFYAFSSENWKRPEEEVSGLMGLLKLYFSSKINEMVENGVRLRVWGDKSLHGKLSPDIIQLLEEAEEKTKNGTALNVNFCINYGGRDEIVRAAQDFADEVEKGLRFVGDLDETLFSAYLDSRKQPDPDLIIRTGGDKRVSNFLLWQLAYAELEFVETAWPDFSVEEFANIIKRFSTERERKFGAV